MFVIYNHEEPLTYFLLLKKLFPKETSGFRVFELAAVLHFEPPPCCFDDILHKESPFPPLLVDPVLVLVATDAGLD